MANARNGNTWYVDATGELSTDANVLVTHIIIYATAANAILELADTTNIAGAYTSKFYAGVATSGDSKHFPFEAKSLLFPKGIRVKTLTNAKAILVVASAGKET